MAPNFLANIKYSRLLIIIRARRQILWSFWNFSFYGVFGSKIIFWDLGIISSTGQVFFLIFSLQVRLTIELKFWRSKQRDSIFSPGKDYGPLTHSFSRNLFFFSAVRKKVCKPLTRQKKLYLQKKSKKGKKSIFPRLAVFFFFPNNLEKYSVFFYRESLHSTHSLTRFQKPEKENRAGKKKQLFHSLIQFLPKSPEKQTFPGKK